MQPHPKREGASPQDHEMTNVKFFASKMVFQGKKKKSDSELMWKIGCPGSCLYGLGLVEFLSGSHGSLTTERAAAAMSKQKQSSKRDPHPELYFLKPSLHQAFFQMLPW